MAGYVKMLRASLVITISLLYHLAYAGRELVPVDDRPDILNFDPRTHHPSVEFDAFEIKMQFQFVAEVLEFYPKDQLYFLARDSEYLYDIARLVTAGTEQASRIHLLNISQTLVQDPYLFEYLTEQGFKIKPIEGSENWPRWGYGPRNSINGPNGEKIRLIDTGLSGTISNEMASRLSVRIEDLRTHLLSSSGTLLTPQGTRYGPMPKTRGALVYIDGDAMGLSDYVGDYVIFKYERRPHYSGRGIKYQEVDGKWRPVGPYRKPENAERKRALKLMGNLFEIWQNPLFQAEFQKRREYVRTIREAVLNNNFPKIQRLLNDPIMPAEIGRKLAFPHFPWEKNPDSLTEAILGDVLDVLRHNGIKTDLSGYVRMLPNMDLFKLEEHTPWSGVWGRDFIYIKWLEPTRYTKCRALFFQQM